MTLAGFAFLTAIPEVASYVAPHAVTRRVTTWMNELMSPTRRLLAYRALFLLGIFLARFMPWDEQYQIAISKSPEAFTAQIAKLQRQLETVKMKFGCRWTGGVSVV